MGRKIRQGLEGAGDWLTAPYTEKPEGPFLWAASSIGETEAWRGAETSPKGTQKVND